MSNLDLWKNRSVPSTFLGDVWGLFDDLDFGSNQTRRQQNKFMHLSTDIVEKKDEYELLLDVPGLNKDDINIELTGHQLTISGERKREEEREENNVYRFERFYGKFQRTFELPEGTDIDNIESSYDNGVLKFRIPKAEISKTRKLKIGESSKNFLKKLAGKDEPKSKAI